MTDVRPFRPCSSSDIAAMQSRAREALRDWSRHWLGAELDAGAAATCRPPQQGSLDDAGSWWQCRGAGGCVWVSHGQCAVVAQLLFGGDAARPSGERLASGVARRALDALMRSLVQAGETQGVQAAQVPHHLAQPGRRALEIELKLATVQLSMLLELPQADALAKATRRETLKPTRDALARQAVRIDVRIGESELDLGTLRMLSVGDVLRLDRKLDEGVDLIVDGQRLPCVGYLAAQGDGVVVEVARS
jgi:flagellar motor switch/type III secretory pathway protein FliN